MNLMFGVGWIELILIVAVLIFITIIYQVCWIEKRNLVVGFTFLIIGSSFFLYCGINGLFNVYVTIAKGWVSFSDFSNILVFMLVMGATLFMTGLGIYGLLSAYRNLQIISKVLKRLQKSS